MTTAEIEAGKVLKECGNRLVITNNNFDGKTHGLLVGMEASECEDGWYQVFKINSHLKHFTRLSPQFVVQYERHFKKR